MTEKLSAVLASLAAQARPASVDPQTWRKGRRRHRLRVAGAVAAVVLAVAALPMLLSTATDRALPPAGGADPVVPSRVYPPWTGQATMTESPGGPAAILVAGDQELRGSDIWGWEGRSLVVGRNGSYRLARTVGESAAGPGGLLLSPDGRYLASMPWVEGSRWPESGEQQTAIVDLTTGTARQLSGGMPVAWAPDGRTILVESGQDGVPFAVGTLRLLDVASGQTRTLPAVNGTRHLGNFAAFSPDGSRLAVATTSALHLYDLRGGTVRQLTSVNESFRLAGQGAWLPDGKTLAHYVVRSCNGGEACDEGQLARREFQIGYLDTETGLATQGPKLAAPIGLSARLLGWQSDGDAVVAVHSPEAGRGKEANDTYWSEDDWWIVGGVRLIEFRADGSRHELVSLPSSALFVDVPANLLDSFGGPAPNPIEGKLREMAAVMWPVGFVCELFVLLAISAGTLSWLRARRRRKAKP